MGTYQQDDNQEGAKNVSKPNAGAYTNQPKGSTAPKPTTSPVNPQKPMPITGKPNQENKKDPAE